MFTYIHIYISIYIYLFLTFKGVKPTLTPLLGFDFQAQSLAFTGALQLLMNRNG